jgi:aminotransferase
MKSNYQICTRCVMDSSEPSITFDDNGICSCCDHFFNVTSRNWFPNNIGQEKLSIILNEIKHKGIGKEYDAILGLSGGIDSSYLALKSKEWGLRLLVVHVDGGWNSEVAVSNIEKLVDYCGYELITHVINWNEMRDLQLSYLMSGVSNQDVPQDHAFFASLYHFAVKNKVPTILSGGNLATEGIAPNWMYDAMDALNLDAIHKKHGSVSLTTFPRISFLKRYFWYPVVHRLRVIRPLNYLQYTKQVAIQELKSSIDWRDYGRKHGESHFTKFYQNYYLPERYGYDKRKPHLSSLIVTEQMTRDEAILKLNEPLYSADELERDIDYVSNKLQISRDELVKLFCLPLRNHDYYANQLKLYKGMKTIQTFTEKVLGKKVTAYS